MDSDPLKIEREGLEGGKEWTNFPCFSLLPFMAGESSSLGRLFGDPSESTEEAISGE